MGVLENKFQDNVIVASMDKLLGWARSTSPWYFQFGLACCAIEMMASAASRHDFYSATGQAKLEIPWRC